MHLRPGRYLDYISCFRRRLLISSHISSRISLFARPRFKWVLSEGQRVNRFVAFAAVLRDFGLFHAVSVSYGLDLPSRLIVGLLLGQPLVNQFLDPSEREIPSADELRIALLSGEISSICCLLFRIGLRSCQCFHSVPERGIRQAGGRSAKRAEGVFAD
jgi:hypothetical protein